MSRRKLIWHIGPATPARPVIAANLVAHHGALEAAGILVAASPAEARLATHELLRDHRGAGLSRREVEGRWARICDRIWQHRGVSVLSTPELCLADKDQIKLALDPLIGVEVHLVVTLDSFSQQIYGGWLAELRAGRTTGWEKYVGRIVTRTPEHRQAEEFWAGHDVPAMLSRWGWTFHDERLHVVAGRDVEHHWQQFLEIAGVRADAISAVVPAYADPAGVAVLRKVNRQLEQPLAGGSADLLTASESASSAMPVAATGALQPMVEEWSAALSGAGYDVRGTLSTMVDEGEAASLPGPRDQLGVAVAALAEALAENTRLRTEVIDLTAERDRLDRKRRKLKRRLQRESRHGG